MSIENLKSRPNLTVDEIDILINNENNVKMLPKLFYFRLRALGLSVKEAHTYANIKKSSAYHLEDLWAEGGYNSLLRKPGGGREPKLNELQLKELDLILKSKDTILVNDILELIETKWGIKYSYVGLKNLLNTQFNVKIDNYFEKKQEKDKNIQNTVDDFENLDEESKDKIHELIDLMDNEKDIYVFKKLIYLLLKEIGFSTKVSSKFLSVTPATGNNWNNQWKKSGIKGLSRKSGQGRKLKMTQEIFEKAKKN